MAASRASCARSRLVHLALAALALHGIAMPSPIDRPALATSFLELWQRNGAHLREAQLFLFYTPALLHLRRRDRYVAICAATAWTMIVGNTLVHVAMRYCFLADPWPRIGWSVVASTLIALASITAALRQLCKRCLHN